jgi:predicted AAA+ superfamily ATPase
MTHWSASSLAEEFDLDGPSAADLMVRIGSYPGALPLRDTMPRWSAYVRDAILAPAVGRDILALAAVRKPALLRQVFGVAAASPAQIVSLQKLQGRLQDRGAIETIAHYLELLEEAYLVAPISKYAKRATRRRSSPPKLVTLNNALVAVTDPRGIPSPDTDPARFGTWVENACLAHAWNAGQSVSYWREEPLEIDGVLEGSWGSWAIEVKTGRYEMNELKALLEFVRRHPEFRPLVICDHAHRAAAERAGIDAVSWQDFLLEGPGSGA